MTNSKMLPAPRDATDEYFYDTEEFLVEIAPGANANHKLAKGAATAIVPHLEEKHPAAATDIGMEIMLEPDILSKFTTATKTVFGLVEDVWAAFAKTPVHKILFKTTQPAHVIVIVAVILLCAMYFPEGKAYASKFSYFIYITAVSLHVGSQFWMTFISGLGLYFNLSRHAFGDVQTILFPKYFALTAALSAVTLVQFVRLQCPYHSDFHTYAQAIVLAVCFGVEFCIRLYAVPPVLRLIAQKTAIEKAAGVGGEIGRYELGPLLHCPHYMALHGAFRKAHAAAAIGNILSIACSAFHLYYLAQKWSDK